LLELPVSGVVPLHAFSIRIAVSRQMRENAFQGEHCERNMEPLFRTFPALEREPPPLCSGNWGLYGRNDCKGRRRRLSERGSRGREKGRSANLRHLRAQCSGGQCGEHNFLCLKRLENRTPQRGWLRRPSYIQF
jgi:hypothetical protein